jgi:hypothetical protein
LELELVNRSNSKLFKLKSRNSLLNRFVQHAVNLSHGFRNTKDGTATTTKNMSNVASIILFFIEF